MIVLFIEDTLITKFTLILNKLIEININDENVNNVSNMHII